MALELAQSPTHGHWSEHFEEIAGGCYWTSIYDSGEGGSPIDEWGFGAFAVARGIARLSRCSPFESLQSSGSQHALLDGVIIRREERPSDEDFSAINGALIIGELALAWVCLHGGLDFDGQQHGSENEITIEKLDRILAWQLVNARDGLQSIHDWATNVEFTQQACGLNDSAEEIRPTLLPSLDELSDQLPVVLGLKTTFPVPGNTQIGFAERLADQPTPNLLVEASGKVHTSERCPYVDPATETWRWGMLWLPFTETVLSSSLCAACGQILRVLYEAVDETRDLPLAGTFDLHQHGEFSNLAVDALVFRSVFNWGDYEVQDGQRSMHAAIDSRTAAALELFTKRAAAMNYRPTFAVRSRIKNETPE